jgi:hypothetical protein
MPSHALPDLGGTSLQTGFQQQPVSQQLFSQQPLPPQQLSLQPISQQFPEQPIAQRFSQQQQLPEQPIAQQFSQQQQFPEQPVTQQFSQQLLQQLPVNPLQQTPSSQHHFTSQQLLSMSQSLDFPHSFDYPVYNQNYEEDTGDSPPAGDAPLFKDDEYQDPNATICSIPDSYLGNWNLTRLPTPPPSAPYPPQRPSQQHEGYPPPSLLAAHNPKSQSGQRMPFVQPSMPPHTGLYQTLGAGVAAGPPIDAAELERRLSAPTHTVSSSGGYHHCHLS